MRIIKYAIAALLIVSISKKMHVQDDSGVRLELNQSKFVFDQPLQFNYDQAKHTVTIKNSKSGQPTTYVGVVQTNDGLPDLTIPALQFITSYQAPDTTQTDSINKLLSKSFQRTSLYGIAVTGTSIPIKNAKNKTIGYYWPDNKIVQLNNGKTYVCIIEELKGNYKKRGSYAVGPIYTWFDTPAITKELLNAYGISQKHDLDFANLVTKTGIGTIQKPGQRHQKYMLYGVLLDTSKAIEQQGLYSQEFIQSHAPTAILKQAPFANLDTFTQDTRWRALNAAQALQGQANPRQSGMYISEQ